MGQWWDSTLTSNDHHRNADDKKSQAQGHTGNTQISNLVEFEILVGFWERVQRLEAIMELVIRLNYHKNGLGWHSPNILNSTFLRNDLNNLSNDILNSSVVCCWHFISWSGERTLSVTMPRTCYVTRSQMERDRVRPIRGSKNMPPSPHVKYFLWIHLIDIIQRWNLNYQPPSPLLSSDFK